MGEQQNEQNSGNQKKPRNKNARRRIEAEARKIERRQIIEANQKSVREKNSLGKKISLLGEKLRLPRKVTGTSEMENISPSKKPAGKIRRYYDKLSDRLGNWWFFIRFTIFFFCFLLVIILGGLITIFAIWGRDLPDVRTLKNKQFAQTTTISDRNGNVLYKIFGDENRKYVPLSKINSDVIDATISIEDKNFYGHLGFDPVGIIRAQLNNLQEDASVQGASTITQQLAKNLYLTPEKSIDRKIKELILALQIEWYFTKDEILEMYLNKIPYGANSYGIEAASNTYFGKSSTDLSLIEASVLAALPKAPSKYSPYSGEVKELMGHCLVEKCNEMNDSNYMWGRKDHVLLRMNEDGKISDEEMQKAWEEGQILKFRDFRHEIKAPHFVFYVKEYLEQKYGKEYVEVAGLNVTTSLDAGLQAEAERIIRDRYEGNVKKYGANNAAMIALDPNTGQVLAMVGSVDYWNSDIDGQVNIITSLRQPGSTFKPLVYAAAIENAGIGSGTILGDYKTKFGRDYLPVNSNNEYEGKMNVRRALSNSRNIPAIKAWYLAGEEEKVLEFIEKIGVFSLSEFKDNYNSNPERKWDFSYGPSMAIGSGEMKLIELAGAYSSFANDGLYNPVNPILKITDSSGKVIEQYENRGVQVMRPETAFIINSILSDILARPAGSWRNILTIKDQNLAAKTGTSNKLIGKTRYPNNLVTIGYTPNILSATWVGNTDGRQTSLRAWGEFTAAPINKEFLEFALKDKPMVEYTIPAEIIKIGSEFYPPNWIKGKNYDERFKPFEKKICTPEEKAKDPLVCKTDEEIAADMAAAGLGGAEIPLNAGGSGASSGSSSGATSAGITN